MYADRYPQQRRLNPGTLSIAIAINAAFVAALLFSSPSIPPLIHRDPPLQTYQVLPDPPPPPPEPTDKPVVRAEHPTDVIRVPVPPIPAQDHTDLVTTADPGPPIPLDPRIGTGTVVADPPLPPPPLPFVDAVADPRYARDFQPDYPASERRAERDGRVTVKVLIGVDGRVKEVRRVAATSDAFFQATLDQALRRWRFRAATRGGVPVETWRTISLTFVMQD